MFPRAATAATVACLLTTVGLVEKCKGTRSSCLGQCLHRHGHHPDAQTAAAAVLVARDLVRLVLKGTAFLLLLPTTTPRMRRSLLQAVYGPASAAVQSWSSLYRWVPILGGFVAFALACAAGANDVATSFGTSVGAGALTMPQAVAIGSLMEVLGVTLMGDRHVESSPFNLIIEERPPLAGLFMWGLFIAMLAATIWLALATRYELPVSSSLAIIGGVIGMAFTTRGVHSVYWNRKGDALHAGGILEIVLSWFLAPAIAAVAAFLFFGFTKLIFLRTDNPQKRVLQLMPLYYGLTVMVLIFFVIYKGAPRSRIHEWTSARSALIAGLSGVMAGVLAFVIVIPSVRKHMNCLVSKDKSSESAEVVLNVESPSDKKSAGAPKEHATQEPQQEQEQEMSPEELIRQFNQLRILETVYEGEEEEEDSPEASVKCSPVCGPARISFGQLLARTPNRHKSFRRIRRPRKLTFRQKVLRFLYRIKRSTFGRRIEYDRHDVLRHALAEKFDDKVEELFSFLQVLTACVASFAHGSNDVAAVMGPYAAIVQIYKDRERLPSSSIDIWVFVLGGLGVSLGFALWGWKLVRCLGGRITFFTPARGFSAQLCAVSTILFASRMKLPVSSTHIVVGAIAGVGAADNIKNVNWKLLGVFVGAWVATLLCTCAISAVLYSFTTFSPSYVVS